MSVRITKDDVLGFLFCNRYSKLFWSPTNIGIELGLEYHCASSRVCPKLKRLVEEGLVERSSDGRYRCVDENRNSDDRD